MERKKLNPVEKPLTDRQKRAIPIFALAKNIDAGCRDVGITDATFYHWLNGNPLFKKALQEAKDQAYRESMETLKGNVSRAVDVLVNLLNAKSPEVQRRAASDLISFALKWKDSVELAERVESIEVLILERKVFR